MKKILFTLAFTLIMPAFASADQSFDPRSVSMGGIGASTSHYLTAPFHNPALVARYNDDDNFAILVPAFGLSAHDGGLVNSAEDISDALDIYDANTSVANRDNLLNELRDIRNDVGTIQGAGAIAVAIPNDMVAANLFLKSSIDVLLATDITNADLALAAGGAPTPLTSSATVMHVQITEFGVALAKEYKFASGTLYYGITPKLMQIDTYNAVFNIDNLEIDDIRSSDAKKSTTTVNFDAGLAYVYEGFTVGLVGKNIIPQEFDLETIAGLDAKYALGPVLTASASYSNELFTIGVDVDVTKTERYKSFDGFDDNPNSKIDDMQMLGIGAEFNAFDWLKLRAGYQINMLNGLGNQFSVGIGLNPFDTVQLDVAAAYGGAGNGGNNAYAGSLAVQLSMTF